MLGRIIRWCQWAGAQLVPDVLPEAVTITAEVIRRDGGDPEPSLYRLMHAAQAAWRALEVVEHLERYVDAHDDEIPALLKVDGELRKRLRDCGVVESLLTRVEHVLLDRMCNEVYRPHLAERGAS
jgi:hypothetical protein